MFISQLESGRTSVSIATLYRIAAALGCSANALLGPSGTAMHVVRNGDGERMHVASGAGSPHGRRLSRSGPDVVMEAWHYVMRPDDEPQDWFAHRGEDFVYVVRGTIVVEFEDGSKIKLGPGDSLHHDGALAHRWVLVGDTPAEAVIAAAVPWTASSHTRDISVVSITYGWGWMSRGAPVCPRC